MRIFTYQVIIKEHHLDTFGHVNNATYFTLFEEARWEFITQNDYGLEKIQQSRLGPTVLATKATFSKELRLREKIVIESSLISYEKKIGRLSQKMLRDGEVCCDAEFTIALFDLAARKLVLPTEEWLAVIGVEAE